jgi:signal transduction histidine kinase/CheY-like chemotaxis protein
MRPPQFRSVLPWLTGLSLAATGMCMLLAIYLGSTAETDAIEKATGEIAVRADTLARQIEADVGVFDFALREAASRVQPSGETARAMARLPMPELPLTSQYIGFMNVLNEVGDVVADSRPNVSRPANFAGRDYFVEHQKNPADIALVGRPFGLAPNQRPSIPVSRRLNRPDGTFAGVVVAGVHLSWLSDLLARPASHAKAAVTVRRGDGLVLMRTAADADEIGRSSTSDPAWQAWMRTGLSPAASTTVGIRLFRRLGAPDLVLELSLKTADLAAGERTWLLWLPPLVLVPGLAVLVLSLGAQSLLRRGDHIRKGANAEKDEHRRLIATMSHELRTPLTGLLGQAELIAIDGGLNARQTVRLGQLTDAGNLLRKIIERVTDDARPGGYFGASIPVPCDVDRLVDGCVSSVSVEAAAKGLELTVAIDPAAPRRVLLPSDEVRQILNNLLKNAVKFTAHGRVTVRVAGRAGNLRIEVADTGPGIPKSRRGRLFGEYDRLDAGTHIPGSGLGLWTTQRLVQAMNGQVGYSENPGGGSLFWVTLPAAEEDDVAVAPDVPAQQERRAEIPCLNILIADDSEVTRGVATSFLRAAGHTVTEVLDGEAAVAEIAKRDFDMLLTDMRMPFMDGLEVTRRIRGLPGHRGRTPVVLVTADMTAIDLGKSCDAGVDVCLTKPFSSAELLEAVGKAALLTPTPDPVSTDLPVLDVAILADLRQTSDVTLLVSYFAGAAKRIDALLPLLKKPDVAGNPAARDEIHDLVGVTGILGLRRLSARLRQFDVAENRAAHAASLREAASEALGRIRELLDHEQPTGTRREGLQHPSDDSAFTMRPANVA